MKTNGLRNKKPAMARGIARMVTRRDFRLCMTDPQEYMAQFSRGELATQTLSTARWHRAAKGRK